MGSGILTRVAKNSAVIMVEKMIEVSIGITFVAILARYFDVETFGVYTLITTFVGLLIAVGYCSTERIVIRDMARDREGYLEYLQGVNGARAVIIMVTAIVIAVSSYFLKLNSIESLTAVFLFTLSEIVSLYGATYMTVFKAFEKMEYNTLITFFSKAITLSGIILVTYLGLGFLSVFIALLLGNALKTFLAVSIFRNRFSIEAIPLSFSKAMALLKESYIMVFSTIFTLATMRMGVFMLQAFGTLRDMAFFQASNNILLQFYLMPAVIASALFPVMARQGINRNEGNHLNMFFGRAAKFMFIISVPLAVIAYFYGNGLIILIYGSKYTDAIPAMQILMLSLVFIFLANLFETGLISEGRQHLFTAGWGIAFFVNLLSSIFFVPRYGFIGSAFAMFLSYMSLCVSFYFFLQKYTSIKLNVSIFIRPCIASITMVSYLYLFFPEGNTLVGGLNIAVALLLYAATLFLARAFSAEEIMFMKDTLSSRFRNGGKRLADIDVKGAVKEKY